jgi:hypothetical protein
LATVRLEIHRLISQKEQAQKEIRSNQDDAYAKTRLQEAEKNLITAQDKENELKKLLQAESNSKSPSSEVERSPEQSRDRADAFTGTPPPGNSEPLIAPFVEQEMETESSENRFSLSDSSILRGLVILTGYLKCGGKITNYVMDEYNHFILSYLEVCAQLAWYNSHSANLLAGIS